YDGSTLLKLLRQTQSDPNASRQSTQLALPSEQTNEILRNTIGLHLKHAMQFFYSTRSNIRIERIILSGDAATVISGVRDYVQQEVGKEVVMAEPFKEMKLAAGVDQDRLTSYAPALMLCCGLALTNLI